MSQNRAWWLLGSGSVLVVGWFLITVWVHGDSGRESATADAFGAVKEESPRQRPNAIVRAGRKVSRPRAPLGAGWRELSIDKAVVHSLADFGSGDHIFSCAGVGSPRALEVTFGCLDWVIDLPCLEEHWPRRTSNLMKRCFDLIPYRYRLENRGVILGLGDFEVRLLDSVEVLDRRVGGVIRSEDEAGVVYLPHDATIGKPFVPSNRDERTNRKLLARWFRDASRHQRRNHVPQVKAGSPFSIFSDGYFGQGCIKDHKSGFVEVDSLRIQGNQIVLKVNFYSPPWRKSWEWWVPLVEAPITEALSVGRYSVRVDWGGEVEIQPGGSHIFTFEVVK